MDVGAPGADGIAPDAPRKVIRNGNAAARLFCDSSGPRRLSAWRWKNGAADSHRWRGLPNGAELGAGRKGQGGDAALAKRQ